MYYNGTEPEVREDMLGIRTIKKNVKQAVIPLTGQNHIN